MCIVDAYTSGTPQDNYGGASEMINQVHCPEKVHVQLYTYGTIYVHSVVHCTEVEIFLGLLKYLKYQITILSSKF